jgi:hypothetical protein
MKHCWWNIHFFQVHYVRQLSHNHPLKGNPCIEIWCNLANNQLLSHKLYEWLKLIELSTTIVMGIVEDGRCLSNLGFMKNNFTNMLTTHSDLAFKMFVKKFIIFKQVSFCCNNEC